MRSSMMALAIGAAVAFVPQVGVAGSDAKPAAAGTAGASGTAGSTPFAGPKETILEKAAGEAATGAPGMAYPDGKNSPIAPASGEPGLKRP